MIRIRQIRILSQKDSEEILKKKVASKLKIDIEDIKKLEIKKRSIDARDKKEIFYVYEVDVQTKEEEKVLKRCHHKDIFKSIVEKYQFEKEPSKDSIKIKDRPIIIGSGPAGLFCAYLLAEHSYHPLIIERGEKVENRIKTVNQFFEDGILNPESNIQYGEGGAGTFSDGKLNTLVKDKGYRKKKVFEILVANGAPSEILYDSHPHIGTDYLRKVIINIRKKIIKMGGEFWYQSCFTDFLVEEGEMKQVTINHQKTISCQVLVLALGNSARDTFEMLYKKGLQISSKPFAVGIRIQHPQKMIDEAQYGKTSNLEKSSYKLVYQSSKNRGVYSFCMCPGGYVINASSKKGQVVVNGMSNYKRESENANSAIVVTISKKDLKEGPLEGMKYQQNLEEKTYEIGKGKIPIQQYGDYKDNVVTTNLGSVAPVFKGKYTYANLNDIFPLEINESIKEAIEFFGSKIKGFNRKDALLAAVESRTSSPIRIERNHEFCSNIKGIYPCGEGSGYAGGITTSAVDGIKVAEQIINKYDYEKNSIL